MPSLAVQTLVGLAVFVAQWLVLGRLQLWGSFPDATLLFLAWLSLRTNRRRGATAGFLLGLGLDVVYGTWGIHMFVKTGLGFLLGSFAVDERDALLISPGQAFFGALLVAFIHNGLLVVLLAVQTRTSTAFMVYALWLGSAAYTAFVAFVVALFATR
jgi:rod shape-determining protein MreD